MYVDTVWILVTVTEMGHCRVGMYCCILRMVSELLSHAHYSSNVYYAAELLQSVEKEITLPNERLKYNKNKEYQYTIQYVVQVQNTVLRTMYNIHILC